MITAIIKSYRVQQAGTRNENHGFVRVGSSRKLGDYSFDQAMYPAWDDRLNDSPIDRLREHIIKGWDAKLQAIDSRIRLLKMEKALLQVHSLTNPNTNCAVNASGASTQGVYTQYATPIDPIPFMPNSMANPLMITSFQRRAEL